MTVSRKDAGHAAKWINYSALCDDAESLRPGKLLPGRPDPLAYAHLQARTHVKKEPDADADRAYLVARKRRENMRALREVVAAAAVIGLVLVGALTWAVTTFGGAL